MTLIKLDDDRDDVVHDRTCNCVDCKRRDAAEEAEELEALGDEPPPWWVPDSLDDEGTDEGTDDDDHGANGRRDGGTA